MATVAPVQASGPRSLTVVNRRLLRYALIIFVATMFGIVFLRQLIKGPTPTQQERDTQQRDVERAAQDNTDPESMRRTLLEDLRQQNERREKEAADAAQKSLSNEERPIADPTVRRSTLFEAKTAISGNSDAARLAGLRANKEKDIIEAEASTGLYAWEAQNLASAATYATQSANATNVEGTPKSSVAGRYNISLGSSAPLAAGNGGTGAGHAIPGLAPGAMSGIGSGLSAGSIASPGSASVPLTPTSAPSPYWLRQGWILPAVINQSLTTDAPGTFRAQVTSDVYDSITGQHLLIERGTMLQGAVNTDVQSGQTRMLLAVSRMDFPNGAYLNLGKWDIADRSGAGGIEADDVNDHFWAQFGAAFGIAAITALAGHYDNKSNVTINVGGGYGGSGAGATSSLSGAAGQALSDTVKAVLQRNQGYKRTLSLEPGDKITIVVGHDLLLPPEIVRSQQH